MMRHWLVAAVACVLPAAAWSGIQGPVSGYVLDGRSHAIRPVNGIPGAATLGTPLAIPFEVRVAAIGRDYALIAGYGDNDRLFLVRQLGADAPPVIRLEGAVGPVSSFAWGDDAAAVVYSQAAGQFQIVTGLPGDPRLSQPIDAGPLGGRVDALAVNAAGDRIVAAGEAGLYQFAVPRQGSPDYKLLAASRGVTAIAFQNSGRDVLFASSATNEISVIRDLDGAGSMAVLAGPGDGVAEPVGLQTANGERELWVANAGSSSLLVFDMVLPGAAQTVPLASPPSRCERLDWKSLLVLNDVGRAPLLLLDWAQDRAVFFVPVD